MQESLAINNKELLTIRDAATHVSYSKDYITKLARERKIVARWIGRQWFVDLKSLKSYEQSAKTEQQLRQQRLSEERKREHEHRTRMAELASRQTERGETGRARAVATTLAVLLCGSLFGGVLYSTILQDENISGRQVAALPTTQQGSAPAAWLPEESAGASFTLEQFEATTTGVLLLPSGATAPVDATQLLSDDVTKRVDSTGMTVLVSHDTSGNEVTLPFVTIPVPERLVSDDSNQAYE